MAKVTFISAKGVCQIPMLCSIPNEGNFWFWNSSRFDFSICFQEVILKSLGKVFLLLALVWIMADSRNQIKIVKEKRW